MLRLAVEGSGEKARIHAAKQETLLPSLDLCQSEGGGTPRGCSRPSSSKHAYIRQRKVSFLLQRGDTDFDLERN